MSENLQNRILQHISSDRYTPQKEYGLARELSVEAREYDSFRQALRDLMHAGRVVHGARGSIVLPAQQTSKDEFVGTFRQNKRGFGFVVPMETGGHEDLFIPPGENGGAITGDIVRAKITERGQRDGKAISSGRIVEIVERTQKRFVGSLAKQGAQWLVYPDGNTFTEPILTPDAASRHIRVGTKVVVELTTYPEAGQRAQGVIADVLGAAGEKDVDLKSVIISYNLPGDFPDAVKNEARQAVDGFDASTETQGREDLSSEVVCTIDPDDAKDYDDAISLKLTPQGQWELGVHIADVSSFVPDGSALDEEARERGNSCYFPGHVIPMLPEILSNGVCSLQEAVPRLCKSAFITFDNEARPLRSRFANTIIKSRKRLRYREAQAILDGASLIPHPDGDRSVTDYEPAVIKLLADMNTLSQRIHKRRKHDGQIELDKPDMDLILDDQGKVIGAVPEDQSYTHKLIEMFMVEANEAVARLLNSLNVPFLRRIHPDPEPESAERLRNFVQAAGHKLPKIPDRKALQSLLAAVHGKPESFAVNLAVLKSLSRAEYSPKTIGHYALASQHYCHFTSPIRRYADLTIHRLLDAFFAAGGSRKAKLEGVPSLDDLMQLGKHLGYTERRADEAERELRQVKILELLKDQVGSVFNGVVTGITNFGIFIQLEKYLIDGLIRYDNLLDDWWDVDEKTGTVRGQRTGKQIRIGDVTQVLIARIDVPRRELDLAIVDHTTRKEKPGAQPPRGKKEKFQHRKGPPRPGQRPPQRPNRGPKKRGRRR